MTSGLPADAVLARQLVDSAAIDAPTPLPVAVVRTSVPISLTLPSGTIAPGELFTFHGLVDNAEHVAIGLGDHRSAAAMGTPLVRIHSECLTGDVFGSRRCDCGPQLREAVAQITARGGYLLYLRQEGRGIGLYSKIDAYALQDVGLDTYAANRALGFRDDERDYAAAAQMLVALRVRRVELLTNNPAKAQQLTDYGIDVAHQRPTSRHSTDENARYLEAKRATGHLLGDSGMVGATTETPGMAP